jgi:multicomponent Na+:H+ antiporter subunit E
MKDIWKRTFFRIPRLFHALPIYLREMTVSNLRVARDTFRRNPRFNSGFVEISLMGYDPIQQWEAACLITMTPGTLSVDLEARTGILLVHTLYLGVPEETRSELKTLIRQVLGEPTLLSHDS